MIKAIIWDFDGVIVNSIPVIEKFMTDIFSKHGKDTSKIKFLCHYNMNQFYKEFTKDGNEHNISIEDFKNMVITHPYNKVSKDIVNKETMKFIRKAHAMGIKNSIASNTRAERIKQAIKDLEVKELFQSTITSCEVSEGKPHPEMILTTLKMLNIKPEEAIFIDDSEIAIQAGIEAGTKTLLLTHKKANEINKEIKDKINLITNNINDLDLNEI